MSREGVDTHGHKIFNVGERRVKNFPVQHPYAILNFNGVALKEQGTVM